MGLLALTFSLSAMGPGERYVLKTGLHRRYSLTVPLSAALPFVRYTWNRQGEHFLHPG